MLRLIPIIGLLFSFFLGFSLEPYLKLNKLKLIGMKDMHEHGILLIGGSGAKEVELSRVTANLEMKWKTTLEVPKLNGYHFNKVLICYNNSNIYWINQTDESKYVSIIDMVSGEFKENRPLNSADQRFFDLENSLISFATDKGLYAAGGGKSVNSLMSIGETEKMLALGVPDSLVKQHFQWIYGNEKGLTGYGYYVSPNHSELKVRTYLYDFEHAKLELTHEHNLKLDYSSFTYNSMIDKELLYFTKKGRYTYAMGKLDHAFKKAYPSSKTSEAFIGFWVAKFDEQMELVYFSEIPFQYFEGYVNKDAVTKSAVIDIKEDVNSKLICTVSVLKNVMYGKKYVITLDSLGFHKAITGGQDFYNFFEYNSRGLHSSAKKSQIRIWNDDWSYYANSSWHTMTYEKEHHSKLLLNIQTLNRSNASLVDEVAYTFRSHQNEHWVLEYEERNSGTLSIYRFFAH